jgi:6-pyruvoyl-tetrahydropterin synthase
MKNIIITTRFSAIHRWPDCPIEEVSYLRNPHRHEFHVTVKAEVNHDNRHVEFIQLKNKINQFLRKNWEEKDLGRMSCEMMCTKLRQEFPILNYVCVMEDGENGAELIRE